MNDRARKILKDIEEKKIKPKSRWLFLAQDYLLWSFFIVATLVGAVAMSVIFFVWADRDWDIYNYLEKDFITYFLLGLPYFWFVILIILSFVAYFNYVHTRKGYLINPYLVVAISLVGSVLLGWMFFINGMGENIDKILDESSAYYKGAETTKKSFWSNSDRGFLAGEIIEVRNESNFLIKDFNDVQWMIVGNNIIWKKSVAQVIGEKIKIIGKIESAGIFRAHEIRPWNNQGNKSFMIKGDTTSGRGLEKKYLQGSEE